MKKESIAIIGIAVLLVGYHFVDNKRITNKLEEREYRNQLVIDDCRNNALFSIYGDKNFPTQAADIMESICKEQISLDGFTNYNVAAEEFKIRIQRLELTDKLNLQK